MKEDNMTSFDFRAATSYATAAAVALVSTAMIFASTAAPQIAVASHLVG